MEEEAEDEQMRRDAAAGSEQEKQKRAALSLLTRPKFQPSWCSPQHDAHMWINRAVS